MTQERDHRAVLFFLPALVGMLAVSVSTLKGPGVGGDATIYIESARNLLNGTGLGLVRPDGEFRLLPYFPPFFPLVLSFFGMLGLDLVWTAQWLNVLLYGGLVWMVSVFSYRAAGRLWIALLTAFSVALSPVLIPVYSWAMSEPLSIFLGFAGLWFVLPELSGTTKNWKWFAGGLVTGLSFLTRYSSAAFLAAWAFFILLRGEGDLSKRWVNTVKFGLAGSLPMLVWVIYDVTHTATVGSRSLESVAGIADRLVNFWPAVEEVVLFWLVPESWIAGPPYPSALNHVAVAVLVAAAVGGLLLLFRLGVFNKENPRRGVVDLLLALVGFSVWYGFVVLGVYLFTYPPITIGSRMFSPVHIAVLWSLGLAVGLPVWLPNKSAASRRIPVILVLLVGWYGVRSARIVRQNYEVGLGYHSLAWQQSETIAAVRQLPQDALIVTNEETAVLFLTGKPSLAFQEIFLDEPLDNYNTRYGDGADPLDEAQQAFRQEGAALVLFDSVHQQLEGIYGDRAEQRVEILTDGLEAVFRGADGAIYYYPQK